MYIAFDFQYICYWFRRVNIFFFILFSLIEDNVPGWTAQVIHSYLLDSALGWSKSRAKKNSSWMFLVRSHHLSVNLTERCESSKRWSLVMIDNMKEISRAQQSHFSFKKVFSAKPRERTDRYITVSRSQIKLISFCLFTHQVLNWISSFAVSAEIRSDGGVDGAI